MLNNLFMAMIDYYAGDAKRIQHFVKVHSFAKLIGEMEHVEEKTMRILEAAAYVHDIGIKPAERKYGSCNGKLQEQEGPAAAKEMLERLHFDAELTERVCYLVGHHHTYKNIDSIDYQILVEADFLVNLYEDNLSRDTAASVYEKIFRTENGKRICKAMFGCDGRSKQPFHR
ncbi:MAG: HD domain-containing protein [Eubacteriales bacterium]|nr:HD domain-containing protein [Eubacteriales bacterium]